LEEQGIVYAESVSDFDCDYFINLGMAEGAIGPFLKGVNKALRREKNKRKKARVNRENIQ
jgi:hypothetical protein